MHIVLNEAVLFLGEGGSMDSESAMLGTPAIYINDIWPGSTNEEEKYGLLYSFKTDADSQKAAILKAIELLKDKNQNLKLWKRGRNSYKTTLTPLRSSFGS